MGESHRRLRDARTETAARVRNLAATVDAIVESSVAANLDDEHDPEGATVGFERAQASAMLEAASVRLAEIDAALERVALGVYGICERCGVVIPAARLEAQPAARTCVTCAASGPDRSRR
jgi:DnaK suppressor protein